MDDTVMPEPDSERGAPPRLVRLVLAGNQHQAERYASENGWQPRDWRYLADKKTALGFRDMELHKVGTWYERDDVLEILAVLARIKQTGPTVRRGRSETVVGTPQAFVNECERRYGDIYRDIAASLGNAKNSFYWTQEDNALSKDWNDALAGGVGWLNPPYDNIGLWAKKADEEAQKGARVLMLVPASVGTNWYLDYVHFKHPVDFLNGRIHFEGHEDPYPKDLMLVLFGFRSQLGRLTADVWTPPVECLGRTPKHGKKTRLQN